MFQFVGTILSNILGSGSRKRKRQEEVYRDNCDDCQCCQKRRKVSCESNLSSEVTDTSSSMRTDAPNNQTTEGTSATTGTVLTTSAPVLTDANIAKAAAVGNNSNITKPKTAAAETKANFVKPISAAIGTNANIVTLSKTAVAEESSTPKATISANIAKPSNAPKPSTSDNIDEPPSTPMPSTSANVHKPTSTTKTPAKDTKKVATTDKLPTSTETISKDLKVPEILDTEIILDQSIHDKLEEEHAQFIRKEFIFPQVNRAAFISAGLTIERGLLLHGSSHGMRTCVNGFAHALSSAFGKPPRIFCRTPIDLFKRYWNDTEKFIKRIEESVMKCEEDTPIIVLFEELRSCLLYCNATKSVDSSSLTSFAAFLKTYLGDNSKYQRLFVIATVDNLQILPKVLHEPGMLRKKIQFSSTANDVRRKYYLKEAVKKWKVQPDDKLLDEMAKKTAGFSPQELHELAQTVLESTVNDKIKELITECCSKCSALPDTLKVNEDVLKSINPSTEQWENVFKTLQKVEVKKPAALPTVVEPNANVTFATVGGLDEQVKYLRENIIAPLKEKDVLKEWGVEPVRGIIFYGPPGTGKTLLAKAMVNELDKILEDQPETSEHPKDTTATEKPKKKYSFFYRKATDCFAQYVGETERILRELFSAAQKQAPSVIFFDEFDGLCPNRTGSTFQFYKNVVTTLLGLMDSVQRGDILVIAATNRLDSIDPAIRRAGRFDRSIGFSMPGKEGRESILQIHTKAWKNGNAKEILEQMAEKTVGYSGADLEQLVRQTLVLGMKRFLETKSPALEVVPEDWHMALFQTKPSNNSGEIAFGDGLTFLQRIPDGVKLLLQSNMTKIEQKLQPIFTAIEEKSKINSSGGLNSFLISSGCENDDVNRYLVPLLLTESKLLKNVAAYTLDLSDVRTLTKQSVQSTLARMGSPPDGKTPLLFVPQIEAFTKLKNSEANAGGIVDYVLTQLQTLRGKKAILLATSKLALKNMQQNEEMLTLFKDIEGSKCHEFVPPSQQDLESFFKTNARLEKEFPKQLECAVNFGVGKDVETLLDLNAEVQCILQQKKGEEKKTEKIILEQLTSLLKAFDNHQKKGQNHFDLYM